MRNRILLLLVGVSTLIFSCDSGNSDTSRIAAIGGKQYGGQFSFMSSEKIESLFPLAIADIFSTRILSQIFEPLLKIDVTTTKVEPSIAESFTVSEDAKVFTFKIRKGVFFHDDDCFYKCSKYLVAFNNAIMCLES